jgi:hypothetical protein
MKRSANTTVDLSSATLRRHVGTYEFRGGSAGVAGFMGSTQTVALVRPSREFVD